MFKPTLILLSHLALLTTSHFVMESPPSLGYNDGLEGTGPCDTFDPTFRTNVTSWPTGGYPINIWTTHPLVILEFRAALISDTNSWVNIIPALSQHGLGKFCLPSVPGYAAWIGEPVVFQMVQFAPDGINYQCAAIVFTEGDAVVAGSDCSNSTGVGADIATVNSVVPFGTTIPYTTAASTSTPAPTSGATAGNTTTTTSSKVAGTTTSGSPANTSKAVSEAGSYRMIGPWTGIAGFLGVFACLL